MNIGLSTIAKTLRGGQQLATGITSGLQQQKIEDREKAEKEAALMDKWKKEDESMKRQGLAASLLEKGELEKIPSVLAGDETYGQALGQETSRVQGIQKEGRESEQKDVEVEKQRGVGEEALSELEKQFKTKTMSGFASSSFGEAAKATISSAKKTGDYGVALRETNDLLAKYEQSEMLNSQSKEAERRYRGEAANLINKYNSETKEIAPLVVNLNGIDASLKNMGAKDGLMTSPDKLIEVPGLGLAGSAKRDWFTWLNTNEAKDFRALTDALSLTYQKAITGAQATEAERKRIMDSLGLGNKSSPQEFILAIQGMVKKQEQRIQQLEYPLEIRQDVYDDMKNRKILISENIQWNKPKTDGVAETGNKGTGAQGTGANNVGRFQVEVE